jgi:hypothetical protein
MNLIFHQRVIASAVPSSLRAPSAKQSLAYERDCFGPQNGPRNDGAVTSCLHTTGNTTRSDI